MIGTNIAWIVLIGLTILGIIKAGNSFFEDLDIKWCLIWMLLCVPLILVIYHGSKIPKEMKQQYSYNIYALEDNQQLKGSKYYIEQELKYYHLADYKDGKKMYSVPRNESYIVEDKTTQPHIEVYKMDLTNPNKLEKFLYHDLESLQVYEYKIVVPEKTLTNNFNIDMKN